MYLTFKCPRCRHSNRSGELSADPVIRCSECGWSKTCRSVELAGSPAADQEHPATGGSAQLTECLRCGNADLWRQKNFPQWAGFTCVALGAVTSSIAWGYHRPELALGILMAFALLDMILYVVMPDVLVCYRCQTKHHQVDTTQHGTFSHELGERYRQEQIRQERTAAAQPDRGDLPEQINPTGKVN